MTRVRVTPWISSHGYARVWVRVPDCHTYTTPYPFPRCYGYAGKYRDSSHVTLLIFDMLIIGYTFVYNDVCDPSNTPPLPQKRDGGLCFSSASPSLTSRRRDDKAQMMIPSFGPW